MGQLHCWATGGWPSNSHCFAGGQWKLFDPPSDKVRNHKADAGWNYLCDSSLFVPFCCLVFGLQFWANRPTKDVLSHVTKSPEAWFPQIGRVGERCGSQNSISFIYRLVLFYTVSRIVELKKGPHRYHSNTSSIKNPLRLVSTFKRRANLPTHQMRFAGSEAAFKDLATLSLGNIVLVDDQRANFQSQFGVPWSSESGWSRFSFIISWYFI